MDCAGAARDGSVLVPDQVIARFLHESGLNTSYPTVSRIIAKTTQKFINDVASSALAHAAFRTNQNPEEPDSKFTLTLDDLYKAVEEYDDSLLSGRHKRGYIQVNSQASLRERDGLNLSLSRFTQKAYLRKVLEKFGMSDCRPVSTPMVKDSTTRKPEEQDDQGETFPYRQAVGALMYLMVGTRPDIAYSVGVVSRTLENPKWSDWLKVKRIFRYLKGTSDMGLLFTGCDNTTQLETFSDADHGGDTTTGRSTSGVVSIFSNGAISWLSQRQASVAISTTEAEIVAASEAAKEMVWLKRLLKDMGVVSEKPALHVDNEAAIRLAQNPEFHRRTKHIQLRHFFVRELVTDEQIQILKVDTENQLADILTKPLPRGRFESLRNKLGVRSAAIQKTQESSKEGGC
ncbi:unnamed protein product [Nesidiocoris tenuis]|uniref:Uncharacterized protein n=1 Tax=Nesidiocoris tenuis TaxID=355587 RepID=A0A6H5FZ20_9HEMI|nr:unnamed protein product [Nesidiocoris tenuis]